LLSERIRIWLMLAPALAVIVLLFMGGLAFGVLQSLGYLPLIGERQLNLAAYASVLQNRSFLGSLLLTFQIAFFSTLISTVLALALALVLRQSFVGKRLMTFIFQLNLPIPHIVGAVALAQVLSQSGVIARVAALLGLIHDPAEFPVLVFDRWGIGIIAEYVWKETPFIGVVLLSVLQSIGGEYEQLAQSLGAWRWQRFRYVLLPLLLPGILSSSVLVFAFVFGAFEIPFFLGVAYPQALPVLAYRSYTDVDLSARPEARAMAVLIALLITALVIVYMRVSRRYVRAS
jgi:putative spermidine/putrescine transport system permease protein